MFNNIREGANYYWKDGSMVSVLKVQGDIVTLNDGNCIKVDRMHEYLTESPYTYGNTNTSNIYNDYLINENVNNVYNNINQQHQAQNNMYHNTSSPAIAEDDSYRRMLAEQLYSSVNQQTSSYQDDYNDDTPFKIIDPGYETDPYMENTRHIPNLKPIAHNYKFTPEVDHNQAYYEDMTPEELAILNKNNQQNPHIQQQSQPKYNNLGQPVTQSINSQQYINNSNIINSNVSPAKEVLNKIKRNYEIDFKFNINTLVPNLDFLKLTQENLDCDIFEALADEITEHLLMNPKLLQNAILKQLKGDEMTEMFKSAKKVEPKIEKPVKAKNKKVKPIVVDNKIEEHNLNFKPSTEKSNETELIFPSKMSDIETITPEIVK